MSTPTAQLSHVTPTHVNFDSEFHEFMNVRKNEITAILTKKENELSEKVDKYRADFEHEHKLAEEARQNTRKCLEILDGFSQFELGRFLLKNRGLDGFWTSYVVQHPYQKKSGLSEWEDWILNRSILSRATQERFVHFQNFIKSHLENNSRVASIPSGLMDDFLCLNLKDYLNLELYAVDIDKNSLELAEERFRKLNLDHQFFPVCANAWKFNKVNYFDMIVSNGLTIYEHNDDKVEELFRKFYTMLKPGGQIITSTLLPYYEWNATEDEIDLETMVTKLIIKANFVFEGFGEGRGVKRVFELLMRAGFNDLKYVNDSKNVFPTIRAIKC